MACYYLFTLIEATPIPPLRHENLGTRSHAVLHRHGLTLVEQMGHWRVGRQQRGRVSALEGVVGEDADGVTGGAPERVFDVLALGGRGDLEGRHHVEHDARLVLVPHQCPEQLDGARVER